MFIIDDLLFWLPLKGLTGIARRVKDLADKELDLKTYLLRELQRIETLRDLRKISQREYEKKTDEIMKKINNLNKNSEKE